MNGSNELLVSGRGTENSNTSTVWVYAVINAVIGVAGGLIMAFFFRDENIIYKTNSWGMKVADGVTNEFGVASYVMVALGIGLAISAICIGHVVTKRIQGTEVNVYEDNIEGVAVDKDFSIVNLVLLFMGWNKARLTNFNLAFNQITSVSLEGNHSIIINVSGANYRCFVSNGPAIQDVINQKIRSAAG